jgi:hypothetical protein
VDLDIVTGCFNLPPKYFFHALGFHIVNIAVSSPSILNAPILQVMAMLLVGNSVEGICTNIGVQGHVVTEPSERFLAVASPVKGQLDLDSSATPERYRQLNMPSDFVVGLWPQDLDDAPRGVHRQLQNLFPSKLKTQLRPSRPSLADSKGAVVLLIQREQIRLISLLGVWTSKGDCPCQDTVAAAEIALMLSRLFIRTQANRASPDPNSSISEFQLPGRLRGRNLFKQ